MKDCSVHKSAAFYILCGCEKQMCSCAYGLIPSLAYCLHQWPLMNETWHQSWQKAWSHQGCFSPLYFNLINVFWVFDPEGVFVGFCTCRFETRQGSRANRGGDGKGRGERGDKAGCWYERKKMQLSLSSTDQSPPRAMHAANMAVLPACGMSLLHQGSAFTENFRFSLSLLIGLCFSFCLAVSSCTREAH